MGVESAADLIMRASSATDLARLIEERDAAIRHATVREVLLLGPHQIAAIAYGADPVGDVLSAIEAKRALATKGGG